MTGLARFGVSLEDDLLSSFDRSIDALGYESRSDAIRDLIRRRLLDDNSVEKEGDVVGVVTLIYNRHRRHDLKSVLTGMQHKSEVQIKISLQITLGGENCLEAVVIPGPFQKVKEAAAKLIATRGVDNGKLVLAYFRQGDNS